MRVETKGEKKIVIWDDWHMMPMVSGELNCLIKEEGWQIENITKRNNEFMVVLIPTPHKGENDMDRDKLLRLLKSNQKNDGCENSAKLVAQECNFFFDWGYIGDRATLFAMPEDENRPITDIVEIESDGGVVNTMIKILEKGLELVGLKQGMHYVASNPRSIHKKQLWLSGTVGKTDGFLMCITLDLTWARKRRRVRRNILGPYGDQNPHNVFLVYKN